MTAKYEFSSEENEKLRGLVSNLRGFVPPLCIFTLLQVVLAVGHHDADGRMSVDPYATLLAVVTSLLSVLIVRASRDFQQIIDTEGSDIEHLMAALKKVRSALVASSVMLLLCTFCLLGSLISLVGR